MPGVAGPNLGIKFGWIDHENGWGGDMNVNLRGLDDLVHLAVLDKDLATPPGSPVEGARYIVAASPTGAWVGHTGHVARWFGTGWIFYAPKEGWRAWVSDEDVLYAFNGSTWGAGTGGSGFAVLAGQAGGQTLYGGTAAGENLVLGSTANATKGKIQFGASSAYDEANVRLGIGTLTPQAGLHVGSNTHTGGASTDAVIEGRLLLGDNIGSTNFTAGQGMTFLQNAVNGGTLMQITYNLGALPAGAASGTLTTIKAGFTGTPGWTSGTAAMLRGFAFTPILTVPGSVTVTDFVGAHVDLTYSTTAGQGSVTNWVGFRSELRGPTSNGPGVTNVMGFQSSPGWRGALAPTALYGFQATKLSTVTYGAGTVASAYGFYVDSAFAASSAVTTWYGYYVPTITGPGTIWGFYQAGTMNSAFGGKTRFGSTTAPAHWIDAAAGTTTVAFMRAATGVVLTTAAAGCFEFDGTRLYFTDGTPTRQTIAFVSDGTGGGTLTHNLLSATHPDTTAGTVARGDLVTGQTGTPKWQRLALGAANKFVGSDGTDAGWLDLPPGARSGITVSRFYPAMLFQVTSIDPLIRSGGSDSEFVSIPFSATVDRIAAATVEIPPDYGSSPVWKIWFLDTGTAGGQVRWRFGVSAAFADAGQADNTKTSNNNDVAAPAVQHKIKALAVNQAGFAALTAGSSVGIRISRPGATDTVNDTASDAMHLLQVELQYTRA